MAWNGTKITNMGEAIKANGTGDLQQAFGSSSKSQLELFNIEEAMDDRWARYRRVKSAKDANNNDIVQIHAVAGTTVNYKGSTRSDVPGYMGNVVEYSKTISGTPRSFITAFGLDVPIVGPSTTAGVQAQTILALSGTTNFNWNKSTYEDGPRRKWDFDGYKPTAGFPIEYGQDGQEFAFNVATMDVGARYTEVNDPDRLFIGDLSKYFYSDKMVWGAVLSRQVGTGTIYYSDILYQDGSGNTFKMSDYVSQYSYRGWVLIRVPYNFYHIENANFKVCIFGYIPPSSGTGKDGYAFLLPSGSGTGQKNPITMKSISASNDPLLKLTFDVSAGKWGRSFSAPSSVSSMLAFPQGIPGSTLSSAYGLYANGSTSSMLFSLTLTNPTASAVTVPLGSIAFDVTRYNPQTWQPDGTTRQTPTYYNSSGSVISGNLSVSANSSTTIYVSIGNIWSGLNSDTTTNYADMMGLKIVNTSYPNSGYVKGQAMFFAKNRGASGWNFSCTWDSAAGRMLI